MYETFYDKLQPFFAQENIQLHCVDTKSFVLSLKTHNIFKKYKISEDLFDFSNLNGNHELFIEKKKKYWKT